MTWHLCLSPVTETAYVSTCSTGIILSSHEDPTDAFKARLWWWVDHAKRSQDASLWGPENYALPMLQAYASDAGVAWEEVERRLNAT